MGRRDAVLTKDAGHSILCHPASLLQQLQPYVSCLQLLTLSFCQLLQQHHQITLSILFNHTNFSTCRINNFRRSSLTWLPELLCVLELCAHSFLYLTRFLCVFNWSKHCMTTSSMDKNANIYLNNKVGRIPGRSWQAEVAPAGGDCGEPVTVWSWLSEGHVTCYIGCSYSCLSGTTYTHAVCCSW